MTLELEAVAQAIGASEIPASARISGWSVDSRTLAPGDLFFALRGPHHDGHDYVPDALARGAAAAVVERAVVDGRHLLIVPDSVRALQELAAGARAGWGGIVVGVTGSAGKTTSKDAAAHLLGTRMLAGKSVGNLNNHVGLPLSILRLPGECRVAVLEMGMNHAGEIRALCRIARPEVAVVTNVGCAHMECFDSIDAVALAKRELIEALPEDGVAVLNADDERVRRFREIHPGPVLTFGFSEQAEVRAERVAFHPDVTVFQVGGVRFETPLPGRHSIMNLLAALAVARVFGIALEDLRDAVRSFGAAAMRGERLEHAGVVIWNDCYNANPEAMQAMLDVLRATPAARRVAVLGEMLELGHAADVLHRQVGKYAAQSGINVLIGVQGAARAMVEEAQRTGMSEAAARFFEDPVAAGEYARQLLRPGDAALFKGSRGVRVERALERVLG